MKNLSKLFYIFSIVLCLLGAKYSDVVQVSPDTYMISKASAAGAFANVPKMKERVIRKANEFAESKGKTAVYVSSNLNRPVFGFPSFEYQFRLVDKDDSEAQGTSLGPMEDISTKDVSKKQSDLHSELIKLDDLRKKGLLTDEEFDTQKQKLLNR